MFSIMLALIFQQLSTHILISSTFTDVMFYDIVDALLFSFPFSPSYRAVLLLQICSTYEFVYDHVYYCVYVYLLNLCSTFDRKHAAIVFKNGAYFT
jgi:hypothetical protein